MDTDDTDDTDIDTHTIPYIHVYMFINTHHTYIFIICSHSSKQFLKRRNRGGIYFKISDY